MARVDFHQTKNTTSNALNLISAYGSDDDDDEEMINVESIKRDREDNEPGPSNKLLKTDDSQRLPLPSIFLNKPAVDNNVPDSEENDCHKGRIRSFAHERGNWATYVFIQYEHNSIIRELMKALINLCEGSVLMYPCEDLHVSLTKTVVLRHHWIESFISTISSNISHIGQFIVFFDSLKVYCNEERTRTFVGLNIKSGFDTLMSIVQSLNMGLQEFNLPKFYEDPSFHMSITWALGDQEVLFNSYLDRFNEILSHFLVNHPQNYWYIHVNNIFCKCGNKLFTFNLAQNFIH